MGKLRGNQLKIPGKPMFLSNSIKCAIILVSVLIFIPLFGLYKTSCVNFALTGKLKVSIMKHPEVSPIRKFVCLTPTFGR